MQVTIISTHHRDLVRVPIVHRPDHLYAWITHQRSAKPHWRVAIYKEVKQAESNKSRQAIGTEIAKENAACENVIKEENVKKMIQESIDNYNKTAVSNAQRVQKFVILDTDFSVPGGELTETQKLKRRIVSEKYSEQIESMYQLISEV